MMIPKNRFLAQKTYFFTQKKAILGNTRSTALIDQASIYRVFFFIGTPPKSSKYKKVDLG